MAQANVKLTVDASGATRALQGVQSKTNSLQKSFGGLQRVIAGVGLTVLARQAVNTSANFEKLNVRLGLLTKASGTFARSQEIAAEAQKSFGLSATEALEGITDITARLQPLGVEVEDIRTTFIGFNTAAKLAGASAMESSNAFRQLAQALGSGRLQGDEFRSIAEQVPTLLAPIAEELDTTVGGLKKFASEGKLTSDVVIRALKKVEVDGAASLKALLENDPTQVFKDLGNEAENLSRAFGDVLAPAVLPVIKGLTQLTIAATEFVNSPIGKTAFIFTGIAFAIKGVTVAVALLKTALTIAATQLSLVGTQALIASGGFKGMAATSLLASGGIGKLTLALGALKLATLATGFGAVAIAIGAITTAVIKHIDKQKEYNRLVKEGGEEELKAAIKAIQAQKAKLEARLGSSNRVDQSLKRQIKSLNDQLKPLQEQLTKSEAIAQKNKNIADKKEENKKIQEEINKLEKDNLAKAIAYEQAEMDKVAAIGEFIDSQSDSLALVRAQINGKGEQVALEQAINNAVKEYGEEYRDIITNYLTANNELKKQKENIDKNKEAAEKLKEQYRQIGQETRQGLVENLREAINGSQTLGQALGNVLNNLKNKLLDIALNKAISGIGNAISGGKGFGGGFLSGLFGKERGGPVSAGGAYVVGERGPEILQMGSKGGNIIPNSQIDGGGSVTNIVVNVDASGSSVEGDEQGGRELGRVISVAIQSELIKQKRPGGLLT